LENENKRKINIRHAVILSLGSAVQCIKIINEIYESNELYYYEMYKKSSMKNDLIKEHYPANNLESINKLIGIFENDYENNSFNNIDIIIKAFNPRIFKYLKNKTIVDIDEFLDKEFFNNKFKNKVGDGLFFDENLNENEIYNNSIVLIYLARRNDIEVVGTYANQTFLFFEKKIYSLIIKKISKNPRPFIQELMEKIRKDLNLTNEFIKRQPDLGTFLDNLIEYKIEEILITQHGQNYKKYGVLPELYNKARDQVFKMDFYRYIGVFTLACSLQDIDSELFMETVPINNEVVDKILFSCANANKGNKVPESEIPLLFIAELFVYSLSYHYNDLKYKFIHSQKQKYFDDVTKLRDMLTEKYEKVLLDEKNLNKKLVENESKVKNMQDEILKLKDELRYYTKKNEKQEKIIAEEKELLDGYKQENEILLDQIGIADIESDIPYEDMINAIKDNKIALVGGNKSSLAKLKKQFTNLIVIEKNTDDIAGINACKAIFINYQWLKHSLVYKIWSEAKVENVPIFYLSGTNIKQIVIQIYNSLKRG